MAKMAVGRNYILLALEDVASRYSELEFVLTEWELEFADEVSSRYSYDDQLSEVQKVIAEGIINEVSKL